MRLISYMRSLALISVTIILFSSELCRIGHASAVSAPVTGTPSPPPTSRAAGGGDGNIVVQLFGLVKDSVVRMVDGSKEMWGNHGRCNEIRAKQKSYRSELKKRWEFEEQGLTPKEMRNRLREVNGGISFEEYMFLSKGKEDRGKLMNMVFLMWGAPKLFPYALMFYPDILPSPFAPPPAFSTKETKLEKMARERAHAVIQTFLSLEKEAHSTPAIAKINIFGRKKQQRTMDTIDSLGRQVATIMSTPGAKDEVGAQMILKSMDLLLYKKDEDFTRGEKRLIQVPKSVVGGLLTAISGPTPLTGITPNFMRRGTVSTHLQKILEADKFLVTENVDLGSLSTTHLIEACNDRMIFAGPGRSDDELRKGLADWLDLAVVQPTDRIQRTGEFYNDALARATLMSYYSLEGARDSRCASYLPRTMFQGQLQCNAVDPTGSTPCTTTAKKKSAKRKNKEKKGRRE